MNELQDRTYELICNCIMYIALTFYIRDFTLGMIITVIYDAICESPTRLTISNGTDP